MTHRPRGGNPRNRPGPEVPHQLFYDSDKPPALPNILKRSAEHRPSTGKDARMLRRVSPALEQDQGRRPQAAAFHGPENGAGKTALKHPGVNFRTRNRFPAITRGARVSRSSKGTLQAASENPPRTAKLVLASRLNRPSVQPAEPEIMMIPSIFTNPIAAAPVWK
jgi:hypothetical protein